MALTDVVQVCTDGSELSMKAVDTAVELAKSLKLPLLGMTAVVGNPDSTGNIANESEEVQERLAIVKQKADAAGVTSELVAEHSRAPFEGILAVAKRYDARLIVMASRGLGSFGSLILGSETQKTLAAADRPVLVIR